MRNRIFFHGAWLFVSILLLGIIHSARVRATDNADGARVFKVSASRATFQASRQSGDRAGRRWAGARLEDRPGGNRVIVSVTSCAARASRNGNGKRIVIGPRPIVRKIALGRARAAGWVLYR